MDGQTGRRTENLGYIMRCISCSRAVKIALSDEHGHVCQLKSGLNFPLNPSLAILHRKNNLQRPDLLAGLKEAIALRSTT